MPSRNTVSHASSSFQTARPSLSYTVVGVLKPKEGFGKALMRKPAKKPVSKPAPLGKEPLKSPSALLWIKRFRMLPPIKRPAWQYESSDEEDAPSKGPSIASLSAENNKLRELLWSLNENLATKLPKLETWSMISTACASSSTKS